MTLVTQTGRVDPNAPKYYFGSDDFDNSAQSGWAELETYATMSSATNGPDLVSAVTNRVFVPQTPEEFAYDADGNLTEDGRFRYFWDGENRMVRVEEKMPPSGRPALAVTYAYDHQGRNVARDGALHIWDGYSIVAENAAASNATVNLWGLDVDGTMQGAGGVGGLLAVERGGGISLPLYDANGNITEYLDSFGGIESHTDYSAFGRGLMRSGVQRHSHGFSTKPWCRKSGLVEYQMRKYMPWHGRWMSRDPYYGASTINVHSYCNNKPVKTVDIYGLDIGDDYYGSYGGAKRINGQIYPEGQKGLKRDDIGRPGDPEPIDGFDRCYMEHDRCIADANDCTVTEPGSADAAAVGCDIKDGEGLTPLVE